MVSMTTFGAGAASPVISRAASRPSMPGIRISMSTTSGRCGHRGHARLAVGGLPHHGDAVGGVKDDAETGPDQFLVVDHEDPDRALAPAGAAQAVIARAAGR